MGRFNNFNMFLGLEADPLTYSIVWCGRQTARARLLRVVEFAQVAKDAIYSYQQIIQGTWLILDALHHKNESRTCCPVVQCLVKLISTVGIQKTTACTVISGTHIMFEAVLFIG